MFVCLSLMCNILCNIVFACLPLTRVIIYPSSSFILATYYLSFNFDSPSCFDFSFYFNFYLLFQISYVSIRTPYSNSSISSSHLFHYTLVNHEKCVQKKKMLFLQNWFTIDDSLNEWKPCGSHYFGCGMFKVDIVYVICNITIVCLLKEIDELKKITFTSN